MTEQDRMDPKPEDQKPRQAAVSDTRPGAGNSPLPSVRLPVNPPVEERIVSGTGPEAASSGSLSADDLERLNQAASKVSAIRGWVEKYADEASALAALQLEPSADEGQAETACSTSERSSSGSGSEVARHAWPVESRYSVGVPQNRLGGVESEGTHASSGPPKTDAQGDMIMNEPYVSETREMESRSKEGAVASESSDVPLETELRMAQQELRRLRERTTSQTRPRDRLAGAPHKRDPRALGLQSRVAQAQAALDARAERIRAELQAERVRLRAYRQKLQEKSRELIEATRTQKAKLIEQRTRLRDREEAISAREAAVEQLKTGTLEAARIDSDRQLEERIRAFEQDMACRRSELKAVEATLCEREAALERATDERTQALTESLAARESALREREAELSESSAELERQREALASRLTRLDDEMSCRRAELEAALDEEIHGRREALDGEIHRVEAELEQTRHDLSAQASVLDERAETLALRDQGLSGRETSLSENETALTRREDALSGRTEELRRKESELERIREELATERAALRQDREESKRLVRENRERSSALEAQGASLLESQTALESDRVELEERWRATEQRLAELEKVRGDLDAGTAALEESRRALAERAAALEEDAHKYETTEERRDEVEREAAELATRRAEVFRREEAIKLREEACVREQAAQASARDDLAESRERMENLAEELVRREREINDRVARAAEIEHGARQVDTELRGERDEMDSLRESYERDVSALETWREELGRKKESLDDEALALRLDRERLDEERSRLDAERAAFGDTREAAAAEDEAVAAEKARLSEMASDLTRREDALNGRKTELDNALARVERDRLALRDRERMVEEQFAEIEATQAEMDEARRRLADRIHETRDLRRKLAAKIKRHHGRKMRLAQDAAEVEERRTRLDASYAEVERGRSDVARELKEIETQRTALAEDRRGLETARDELEQSRRLFEAGLRQLEEDRRDVSEREALLADKADQLEAFRDRLEAEHAELKAEREEFVAGQSYDEGSSERLASLLDQAERETEQLKERAARLETEEAAVAARVTELARAEEALQRERRMQEERALPLEREIEEMEKRRAALEVEMSEQRSAAEGLQHAAQASIDARREQLRERERELEDGLIRRREELEKEFQDREQESLEELHEKFEAEEKERMEAIARREEEAEERCAARIEEVERDIEQRLEQLEEEIKRRRQRVDVEIAPLERAFEDEMRQASAGNEDRIEDLRRRRAAVEAKRRELGALDSESDEPAGDSSAIVATDHPIEEVATDRLGEAEGADVDFMEAFEADFDSDAETRVGAREEPDPGVGMVPAERPDSHPRAGESRGARAADGASASPRRFRPVPTLFWAGVLGFLAAGFYLWSPEAGRRVQGRLVLNSEDPGTQMSSLEVVSDLMGNPSVFEAASKEARTDLARLVHEEVIQIMPSRSGGGVEMTSHVSDPSDLSIHQGWLDALGRAYVRSLGHREVSESRRRRAVETARRQRGVKRSEWEAAAADLRRMEADFETAFPTGDESEVRTDRAALKEAAAAAQAEAEAARRALEAWPQTAPTGPIVPREADVVASMSTDRELVERMAERTAKARAFHEVLATAVSGSQTPLTTLLSSIDSFSSEVQRQLEIQTDPEILQELETVAVGLSDYARHAETYADQWDELAPKMASWTPTDDPDLLLEYQKQAETLVRTFYDQSRKSFGDVTSQADAIGRGGAEMTKRRIIHNSLQKLSHAGHAARNEWIEAVDGVVPANNLELKALRDTLKNLSMRLEQGRAVHRAAVEQRLKARREKAWADGLTELKTRVEKEDARYRELSHQALVAMESALQDDQVVIRDMQARREEIDRRRGSVSRLERELAEWDRRVDRLEAGGAMSMAGAVRYEASIPVSQAMFDWTRRGPALGLGGGVAMIFMILVWMLSRQRRHVD